MEEHPQRPPWEDVDLSPRQSAVRTVEYHRSQGKDDPEFLQEEVIRVLSEHLARAFAAGCRRQLARSGGDIESLLRRPAGLNESDRCIDEALDTLFAHVAGLFRRYGVKIPESFLQGFPTNAFFEWHDGLRSQRFPEAWKAWGFREPTGKERERALSNLALACDYGKWYLMLAVDARSSLDVTWKLWTGPLGYGGLVNTLADTLALLAEIRPEHVIAGLRSHEAGKHGRLGARSGVLGGRSPDPVKTALMEKIRRLLQIDEEKSTEALFYGLDGEELDVEAQGSGAGRTERCRILCNHDSSELIIEGPEDKVISLRTFEKYVTEARKLDGPH